MEKHRRKPGTEGEKEVTSTTISDELRALGRYMTDNDLVWGNSGNISARTGDDTFLISASGAWLGDLAPDDLVECSIGSSRCRGAKRPSKEVHCIGRYAARRDINSIIHSSPFYSTLIACTDEPVFNHWFVESMYYLERVARVGYSHPGSEELVQSIQSEIARTNILLMENHGVLVCDTSVKEARMALHTLEVMCRMIVVSKGARLEIQALSKTIVEDFLANTAYRPRRRWPDDSCGR